MLTLKQAFSVAALQQNSRTQSQQCDSCPLQQLHKLCDRIEGETSTVCHITHGYHVLSLYQPIPLSYCIPLFLHLSEVLVHTFTFITRFSGTLKKLLIQKVLLYYHFFFYWIIKGDTLKKNSLSFFHTVTNTLLNVFERSAHRGCKYNKNSNILKHFISHYYFNIFKKVIYFCGFISVIYFFKTEFSSAITELFSIESF